MRRVILWKFPKKITLIPPDSIVIIIPEHVISQLVDDGLPGLAGLAAAALLGLDIQDLVQDAFGGVDLATK